MANENKTIVLAGATGDLGSLIAHHCLEVEGLSLRLLVRSESVSKLSKKMIGNAEVFEIDLTDATVDELVKAFNGADAVVSALQGGPDIMIETQLKLLSAADQANVKRFVPSCFSYNIFGLDEGDNINSDMLRAFSALARDARVKTEVVQILIGAFLDYKILFGFLGAFDLTKKQAFLWGDGNEQMDYTTYEDTARYTVEVALDDNPLPPVVEFAGETLNFHELVKAYEKASGNRIEVLNMGSLSDLDETIINVQQDQPDNMFAWLPLMYWRAMLSGKAKLHSIDNSRYSYIKPLSVVEYVKQAGL